MVGGSVLRCMLEVFTNSYGSFGARETVLGAARLGLHNMELGLWSDPAPEHDPLAIVGENSTPGQLAELRNLADAHGVYITSAFGHADLHTSAGLDILRKQVDMAADFGARYFTVSAPERSSTVYDHLLELAECALRRGLVICLETHPPLVPDAAGGLQTMRDLQHSNIRINFDTANPYYYNESIDVVAELEKLAGYVAHVHLKESRKRYHDWYFPALGEGSIDFPGVFRVLTAAGFYGPYSLELEGIEGEERTLALHHTRVATSVEYLRNLGVI